MCKLYSYYIQILTIICSMFPTSVFRSSPDPSDKVSLRAGYRQGAPEKVSSVVPGTAWEATSHEHHSHWIESAF